MSDADGVRLISDRLAGIAREDPGRELVFDPVFGRFSYAAMAAQVERVAHGLVDRGIRPGDVAILQLPNWAPFITFHIALTAVGAITAVIPLVYREREVRRVAALTGARVLVVPDRYRGFSYRRMAERVCASCPDLRNVFLVGAGTRIRSGRFVDCAAFMAEPWERTVKCDLAALAPGLEDVTAIGFTSGTTGDLKGATFDTRILAAVNRGFVDRYRLDENDRIFGGSPLGHAVGFTHALRMTLTIGGSIVLQQQWEPGGAIDLIGRERCTYMAAATPFLMDVIGHPGLAKSGRLPSLRLFLCGGASVPEQLAREARQALPHTFTSPLWGMTECGGVTTCPFDAPEEKRHATDGTPCGSMELKVVDASGEEVPRGVEGELLARGPMVARGYYGRDDLTREYFLPDGFFRTGDQARMDEDGYIRITGRIKDLIIRGGVNVAPAEIESLLFSHPKVVNAAVVGMPDPRLGERICAFVILGADTTLDLEEVRGWMADAGLAKPKWPERIEVVDAFPMTASGKVRKFRLREAITARIEAERGGRVS